MSFFCRWPFGISGILYLTVMGICDLQGKRALLSVLVSNCGIVKSQGSGPENKQFQSCYLNFRVILGFCMFYLAYNVYIISFYFNLGNKQYYNSTVTVNVYNFNWILLKMNFIAVIHFCKLRQSQMFQAGHKPVTLYSTTYLVIY